MSKRTSYTKVVNSFIKEGYTLLTKKYKNNKQKLEYVCSKGHKHTIAFSDWLRGRRCPYCTEGSKVYGRTIESIRNSFNKEDYILLSKTYVGCNYKLKYICPNNNTHSITWHNWETGYRCPCYKCQENKYNKLSLFRLGKFIGKDNPNWKGGITRAKYCQVWSDEEYKQDIRDRDGNKCLNPYCYLKNPDDLTIHHIDYNKENCHPNNLITLCRSCNSRANSDRSWHKSWYSAIIIRRNY